MERIQIHKQHVRREAEVQYDPLPDPIDESELLEETELMLGKIAVVLEGSGGEE